MEFQLEPRCTPSAFVKQIENGWRLEIPPGVHGAYRLAQLDDYHALSRSHFLHSPEWTLSLQARVSASNIPGTWGFGLWNDPFGFSVGLGGTAGRLPALPGAAWFFHASPQNWLSLQDGIPAHGFFAGSIHSPGFPSLLLAPVLPVLPLLVLRPFSQFLRKVVGRIILQDAVEISDDCTIWREYSIRWQHGIVEFKMDGITILKTVISPRPPLGLVLWIDNQFASWTPDGRLGFGTLDNPVAFLEIKSMVVCD